MVRCIVTGFSYYRNCGTIIGWKTSHLHQYNRNYLQFSHNFAASLLKFGQEATLWSSYGIFKDAAVQKAAFCMSITGGFDQASWKEVTCSNLILYRRCITLYHINRKTRCTVLVRIYCKPFCTLYMFLRTNSFIINSP